MSGGTNLIYILYGTDDYSSRKVLREIKNGLGDADTLSNNTTELEGAKLALNYLRAAAEAFPFFGDKRLVIVHRLLTRFEPSKKAASAKSTKTKDTKAEDAQSYANLMKTLPSSTVLVLLDGEISKTNPLLKALEGAAQLQLFTPLKGAALEKWGRERVRQMDGIISEEALNLLLKMVGSDLWVLAGEIDKLIVYAGGRQIEASDVESMVAASREASIFELVDSTILGNQARAHQVLAELMRAGEAPAYILFMLTRQLRLLVRVKDMLKDGHAAGFIQGKLGLIDFVYNKTSEQAGRYSMERLKEFYHTLLDTDVAIKGGKYNEDLALSILVTELCRTRVKLVSGH
jgi:DNA polymerase-3 subunit delta